MAFVPPGNLHYHSGSEVLVASSCFTASSGTVENFLEEAYAKFVSVVEPFHYFLPISEVTCDISLRKLKIRILFTCVVQLL